MQIDEVAYLDQLHEKANDETLSAVERGQAKLRFMDLAFRIWPEVSKAFDDFKHSL